jgi:alanine-synthesizing transaminase
MFSRRVPSLSEPNPWSLALAAHQAGGGATLDLTETNPTRVGLGGAGKAELAALADPAVLTYAPEPRGLRSAREAVSAYYAERGAIVRAEAVVLIASTSEAYAHLFRLLCDPGDRVLIPAPSYPLFEPLAALESVTLAPYRLAYDGAWHLDLESMAAAMSEGARAIVLVQPNNPTGSCLSEEELKRVEALAERHDAAIISDEVFGDFPWATAGGPLPSLAGLARVPTFVLSGLSKVAGMPQMKLAWIAASGPERELARALEGLEWIADLFLSVAAPVQVALPRLLAARHSFQTRVRERLAINLSAIARLLEGRPEVSLLAATGGWSAVLRLPARHSGETWAIELLRRHGVQIHPGHFYDFDDEAHLVASLIVEPETFAAGLDRLAALLREP